MWIGIGIGVGMGIGILLMAGIGYLGLPRLLDRRIVHFQNDLMEKYYEEVSFMYRQTRGWRHDYHNHIQTLKACLAMGETAELESYLNKLERDLTDVDILVRSGNVWMDAVLNSKLSLAKSKGIRIHVKATVPEKLKVSNVDLSLILGNLLDNAMESCMKLKEEKRFIRVYIDVMKEQLYLYVMNAVDGQFKKKGELYLSTKKEGVHGFGLMRLDRVVEKYHGYLNRQDETDVFVTEVLLPL